MSEVITTTVTAANTQVFTGRWGYYSVSVETCRLLKKINKARHRAYCNYKRYLRWKAKAEHNRVIRRAIRNDSGQKIGTQVIGPWPEPALDPVFVYRTTELDSYAPGSDWQRDDVGRPLYSLPRKAVMVERTEFAYRDIEEMYRRVRRPVSSPELVKPIPYSAEEIRALADEIDARGGGNG